MMLLTDFFDEYCSHHQSGLKENTIKCFYLPAISDLKRFLGREPTVEDLHESQMSSWQAQRIREGRNLHTLSARRRALFSLWRAAAHSGKATVGPQRVRRLPQAHLIVLAWTEDELRKLLCTIEAMPELAGSMPKSKLHERPYWMSLVQSAYQTGMRLGDLLSLERDWIRTNNGEGYLTIVQSKTGLQKTSVIDRPTMELIDQLMSQQPNRRLIWSLCVRREWFYQRLRLIVRKAGIRRGTFRWLRRSGATHVERENPGCGFRHAGHKDSRTTEKHYLDRSQLDQQIIRVKSLG